MQSQTGRGDLAAARAGQDGSRAGTSLSGMVCAGKNREEQGCKQGRDSAGAVSQKNDL